MKRMRFGLLLAVALGAGLLLATSVRAEPPARGGEEGGDGEKRSIVSDVSMKHGAHGWAFECTASTGGANTRLDCDEPFPNNEPQIVVDPTNSQHMIAS